MPNGVRANRGRCDDAGVYGASRDPNPVFYLSDLSRVGWWTNQLAVRVHVLADSVSNPVENSVVQQLQSYKPHETRVNIDKRLGNGVAYLVFVCW